LAGDDFFFFSLEVFDDLLDLSGFGCAGVLIGEGAEAVLDEALVFVSTHHVFGGDEFGEFLVFEGEFGRPLADDFDDVSAREVFFVGDFGGELVAKADAGGAFVEDGALFAVAIFEDDDVGAECGGGRQERQGGEAEAAKKHGDDEGVRIGVRGGRKAVGKELLAIFESGVKREAVPMRIF
jgi:hypothetical protein